MKRFLQNLFLTSGFMLTALAALAQAPTFSTAVATTTTNIRVTFGGTGGNLTVATFSGFTITGATITAANIVPASKIVDLTVNPIATSFNCTNCVSLTAGTVTDGVTPNGVIAAAGNNVTDGIVPVAPGTADLNSGSDSGALSTDDITNLTAPTFENLSGTNENVTANLISSIDGAVGSGAVATGNYSIIARIAKTGTITATLVSTTVTGAGTSFTTELAVGKQIWNAAGTSIIGTISAIGTNTSLTLTANATNAITAAAYSQGLSEGTHSITVTLTDAATNTSTASAGLNVTIDTTPTAAPGTPNLLAASDTGILATDDLTKLTAPTIDNLAGTNPAGTATITSSIDGVIGSVAVAGGNYSTVTRLSKTGSITATIVSTTVTGAGTSFTTQLAVGRQLWDAAGTTFIGTIASIGSNTSLTLTANASNAITAAAYSEGLAQGSHGITVTITDVAGNVSAASSSLSLTIDTAAPAAPGTPNLLAASDTGSSTSDDITNLTAPTIDNNSGTNPAGTVTINSSVDGVIGSAVVAAGNYTTPVRVAKTGTITATVISTTVTGVGTSFTTELAVGRQLWNAAGTSIIGTISVISSNIALTLSANATNAITGGAYSQGLAEGAHAITAFVTDDAGNIGAASGSLALTIDTTPTAAPGTPNLLAASDTGSSNSDDITNLTAPTIDNLSGTNPAGTANIISSIDGPVGSAAVAGGNYSVVTRIAKTGTITATTISTAVTGAGTSFTTELAVGRQIWNAAGTSIIGTISAIGSNTSLTLTANATNAITAAAYSQGLAEGNHNFTATITDPAGNVSAASALLAVSIDTTPPAAAGTPDLLTASDLGSSSVDDITNATAPTFQNLSGTNPAVTVTINSSLDGNTGSAAVAGGNYSIVARIAKTGTITSSLVSTNVTGVGTLFTTELAVGRKIWDAAGTTFVGTVASIGSNTSLTLTANAVTALAGAAYAQGLTDGVHLITATTVDAAGNIASSASLSVTIDTAPPTAAGTPNLLAASDTGSSNVDNITNLTAPTIDNLSGTNPAGTVTINSDVDGAIGSAVVAAGNYTTPTRIAKTGTITATVISNTVTGAGTAFTTELVVGRQLWNAAGTSIIGTISAIGSNTSLTLTANATNAITAAAYSQGLSEGAHIITATTVDVAGNIGTSASLNITIDTTPPAAPAAAPNLLAASDTGSSSVDDITNLTAPTFDDLSGTNPAGTANISSSIDGSVGSAAVAAGNYSVVARIAKTGTITATLASTTVTGAGTSFTTELAVGRQIWNAAGTSIIGTISAIGSNTSLTLTANATNAITAAAYSQGLAEGNHNITATITDAAGNTSTASALLAVTIDRTPPTAAGTPDLLTASDLGSSSVDNITNATAPTFENLSGTNPAVTVTINSSIDGITGSAAVAGGNYSVVARIAKTGTITSSLVSTNVTGVGTLFTTELAVGRKIWDATGTTFVGTVASIGSNTSLTLTANAVTALAGVAYAQGLTDGAHLITATTTDAAGNIASSASLSVTIDTAPPVAPGTPNLLAASDSGLSNTDNITNVTAPTINNLSGTNTNTTTATVISSIDGPVGSVVVASGNYSLIARQSKTGTITSSTVSTTVTGVGTLFTTELAVGRQIWNGPGTTLIGMISAIGSNTSLTLTANAAVNIGGAAYTQGLSGGNHTITVTQTDVAGNTGVASASLAVTVDITRPTISGAPVIYFNASSTGGNAGNKEVVLLQTSEPMALVPSSTPLTGTITVASGSQNVVGTLTLFTTELAVGMSLFKAETIAVAPTGVRHRFLGVIQSISSNTALTLVANTDLAVTATNAFTRGLPVADFDNNGGLGFNVDDANNDGEMTSKKANYFSSYAPPYINPATITNVVRIISKDDGSDWLATSSQVSYAPGGNFFDIAGNEFTMAPTAITSGSTTPPALVAGMTMFPRSTNPEKIEFNLNAQLSQRGLTTATGTITTSIVSTAVTGVGTLFTTEFAVGQQLWDDNGYHYLGTIQAIGSDTGLTLTSNASFALTNAGCAQGAVAGTITSSIASPTVTGVGTSFTTELAVGQEIWDVTGANKIGTISAIGSNTSLTLSGNALVTLAAVPYTISITGFTSTPAVPFSAIYSGNGDTNKITLISQANGAFTGATTISYTGASGNAVGINTFELLDIVNQAVVIETVAPVITSVSIPNVSMKVGDNVIATITTQDDDGDNVTLVSGALNGFALGGLINVTGTTTKTVTFTVVEGGTDVPAGTDILFSTNLVLNDATGPLGSAPFSTAISQGSDRIDANSPKVVSINRQTTVNNGAPSFGTSSASSIFRITFSEDISGPTLTAADFAIRMKGIGTGTITSSTGSATVTGVGTSFTTELIVGSEIWDRTGTIFIGTVSSIATNTSLTLALNAAANLVGTPYSSPSILSLTGATITGVVAVTGTSVFDVTVGTYTGLGVLGIDYVDNNDANAVLDLAGNGTITSLVNPDGDFAGQTYQIVLPQPSTHVTAFTAVTTALDNYSIKLDWTGTSTGATNYLIIARGLTDVDVAGTYPAVADKTPVADDTNFGDGSGAINISSALNTFTFTTLLSGKSYDFTIIPYALSPNNTTDNIDFFIAGAPVVNGTFVKRASATTLTAGSTAAPATISSLSTAFGAKNFTFTITDDGGTAAIDNARTKFTQLVISAGVGNTVTDWSQVIQEAELRTFTETTTIFASGAAIVGNTITFTTSIADNAEGEVDDDEVKEYELRIRLKNPMTGTAPQNVDGQIFVFQANVGGFTTAATPAPSLSLSSLVGVGETEDSGAGTTVNVVATQLSFLAPGTVQPPATAFVLANLTATPIARAIDANGNTDKGYGSTVTITNTGGLPMSSNLITAASGIITFPAGFQYQDDLVFAAGNGTLTITDGVITPATTTSVTVSYSNTSTITAGALSEPASISSLTNTNPGTAVFDFVINEDFGAAGDGSHTRISNIVITQGTGNDIANWTQAIAGARLTDGTNTLDVVPTAGNITFSGIDITSLGLILDGTSKTYTLRVWLNSAMGGTLPSTVDNLNLVFEVLQANITPTSLSSTIALLENENSGSTNVAVDVITTKLVFSTSPAATLLPNVPVSTQVPVPVVEALDANNNRDLNYNSTTIAVTNAGSIPMANAPTASSLNSGILTFPGSFQYNNIGNGTLTVSSTTLPASGPAPTSAVSTAVSVQSGSATTFTAGGSASSTIASTVNTLGAAVGAFNFTVNDDPAGTPPLQDDGNPTLITQMIFNQTAPNTITDWTEAIAGAELSDGTNITPANGTVTINPTNITISGITTNLARTGTITTSTASPTVTGVGTLFTTQLAVGQVLYDQAGTTRIGTISAIGSPTSLTLTGNASITLAGVNYSTANLGLIADNGTKTYTLRIFLKPILGGTLPITIDGLAFGFEARTVNFTTNLSGTSILPGQTQTSGANDVVTVVASKLTFVQLNGADGFAFPANPFPGTAFINAPFSPRLGMEAQDVNGNRDLGFTGLITAFTVNNSLGTSNNPAGSFAGGLFKFPSLVPASSFIYTSGDNQDGALTVTAGGVTSTSPPINVRSSQDAYVYFDATGYKPLIKSATQQLVSPPTPADANTSTTLARLVLSDGGAANFESTGLHSAISDSDMAFTRISQIQFSVLNFSDLRTLALYNNAGVKISTDQPAGATVNFTGLNIQAADNDTIKFTVRTTFNSTIAADHDLIQLRITGVTQSAGSLLYQGATPPNAAYKGGILNGDLTPITVNRLDVVATKLVFTQEPPSFAGTAEPVPYSGIPVTMVAARDANNNLDLDFDTARGTTADISSTATLVTNSFSFSAGLLNLGSIRYNTTGNGTLTVSATNNLPFLIEGVPGPVIAIPSNAISTPVSVLNVTAGIATGGIVPGPTANLAGGAVDRKIFGVTFTAPFQSGGHPDLNSFIISFGLPVGDQITDILTNFRVYENTSGTFGGPNISSLTGTITPVNANQELLVSFSTPRDLSTPKSYFLEVDVVAAASGSTSPIQPQVIDGLFGTLTEGRIVTTRGSADANVVGNIYNFSAIFPPNLEGSYPQVGQLNVATNQPKISLNFSVPVWTLNNTILLNDQTDPLAPTITLTADNGQYSLSSGGTNLATLANPVIFTVPSVLSPDHVYYITIPAGVFNGPAATNNRGFMDQAGNLFTGISFPGTLYFKTANPNAPSLLSTPTSASSPDASGTTVGGTVTATFDRAGNAYYLILPNGTATPTPDQVKGIAVHPSTVAKGNFAINQVNPNSQFGNFTPQVALTAGNTYDVWMSASSESEFSLTGLAINAVKTQIPATSPLHYGSISKVSKTGTITAALTSPLVTGVGTSFLTQLIPGRTLFDATGTNQIGVIASITSNTSLTLATNAINPITAASFMASGFEVGAGGPTLFFVPTTPPATVTLNQPSLTLCTNVFQVLNQAITISESVSANDFSAAGNQSFNLVLPAGFEFDNTMNGATPKYGTLTVVGNDFLPPTMTGTITTSTISATVTGVGTTFTTQFAPGNVIYNATGTLVGTVLSVTNNTTLQLTSNASINLAGASFRGPYILGNPQLSFIGSAILRVGYNNTGSSSVDKIIIAGLRVKATVSSSGQIVRFGGNALPSVIDLDPVATISSSVATGIGFYNSYSFQTFNNTTVTTIPDNFEDPNINQPLVTQLFPSPPFGDYGASSFSGPGVNVNLLNLTAVTLGTPFNIKINHTDNNGCPSELEEQYTVYDNRTAIADLSPVYCSRNDQFTVSNPDNAATTLQPIKMHKVTFNKLQSYYLDGLTADIPVTATSADDAIDSIRTDQIIFGPGWKNLLNKGIATGTVSSNTGSNIVTGVGTTFTTDLSVGTILYDATGSILIGAVRTISSNTSLTLTTLAELRNELTNVVTPVYNGTYSRSRLLTKILYPPGSSQPTTQGNINIGPAGGYLPLNNPLPGPPAHEYFDYIFDEATILNAKKLEPSIVKNPYDYFKKTTSNGNVYYDGGSIGVVQFTGTFQSIANAGVRIPLIQNVRFFVPAFPIIETSAYSFLDTSDPTNLPGSGNLGAPAVPTVGTGGSRSSNTGTPVFCKLGGLIQISAFPAASPGASLGRFTVVDHADTTKVYYDNPPGGPAIANLGFTDNTNGTATIDPTKLSRPSGVGQYRNIRIKYTYQANNSPCQSVTYQVIRISPNPRAEFTFVSTPGPNIVGTTSTCSDEPITFTSAATSADPINNTLKNYDWDFGDPTASDNKQNGVLGVFPAGRSVLPHIFANPSATVIPYLPLPPYVVAHKVTSFYGCPSVTLADTVSITPRTLPLNMGEKPVVNFSLTGVGLGDTFKFVSRDGVNNTTTSANDAIKEYIWTYGPGATPATNTLDVADGLTNNTLFNAYVDNVSYATIGVKSINLQVQTVLGCRNSLILEGTYRDIVVLDTTLFVRSTAVYEEKFNTTSGNWQVWATGTTPLGMAAALPNTSWAYGAPPNPFGGGYQTIYDQIAGAGSWKTNINGNYNANESSALYSPSFKMDSLKRPMISFNAIVQTASSDGVVLQFSTDSLNIADPKKSWKTLGTIGDGEDWFNLKALAGNPGEQILDDLGWSGTDSARWLAPKHTLDTIGKPHPQTVFRFALGVAAGSSPNLGFTLDNVRIGDRTRTILLESFANTGNSNADEKAEADFVANFQNGTFGTEVVKLNYHVNFPGKDPFNEDNPADPSSRALFYNITATPRSVLDGQEKGPAASPKFSDWGQDLYNLRSLQLAQADIAITAAPVTLPDGTVRLGIGVDITSNVLTGIQSDAILHVVVMEQDITLPLSPNTPENVAKQALINGSLGYSSFEYVVKQMLPSAAGSPFGDVLPYNSTRHFPDQADPASRFIWRAENSKLYDSPDDIAIAVFLQQSTAPYEVYQVEIKEPVGDPAIVTGLEPISSEQVIVYPNPANREMTVKLPGPLGRAAGIQMVDQTGRITMQNSIPEGASSKTFNVSDLSGGVYILQIDLGQGVITRKKVMIVHQD